MLRKSNQILDLGNRDTPSLNSLENGPGSCWANLYLNVTHYKEVGRTCCPWFGKHIKALLRVVFTVLSLYNHFSSQIKVLNTVLTLSKSADTVQSTGNESYQLDKKWLDESDFGLVFIVPTVPLSCLCGLFSYFSLQTVVSILYVSCLRVLILSVLPHTLSQIPQPTACSGGVKVHLFLIWSQPDLFWCDWPLAQKSPSGQWSLRFWAIR